MRYIKRRVEPQAEYDAQAQRHRIVETARVKRCNTCTFEVPEGDIVIEDGLEHCPLCRDVLTAKWKADEEGYVAGVKAESARRLVDPPQFSIRSLSEAEPGAITSITDSSGNRLSQSTPLTMIRTVATTVKLIGVGLSSAMTFTYPAGITIGAEGPIVTSTLITLALTAAFGMATGDYSLTVGDGLTSIDHVYYRIFRVR